MGQKKQKARSNTPRRRKHPRRWAQKQQEAKGLILNLRRRIGQDDKGQDLEWLYRQRLKEEAKLAMELRGDLR